MQVLGCMSTGCNCCEGSLCILYILYWSHRDDWSKSMLWYSRGNDWASRWFEVFIKKCDSSNDDGGNYSSINSPVRRFLYDLTLSGLLNQACLCSAKPSCSGVGITGIMPIEMVSWPGIASSVEKMGLGKVSNKHLSSFTEGNLLSIYSAKPSMYWISAAGSFIIKELQRAISIFYINSLFFDGEIGRCYRARCFSTVFAMADVTTWFCEEVVVDSDCDATAQTAARYRFFEGG
jgi:hypothetical protein